MQIEFPDRIYGRAIHNDEAHLRSSLTGELRGGWQAANLPTQPIANRRYKGQRGLEIRCIAGCQPTGHVRANN